jgi:hypothetical protein
MERLVFYTARFEVDRKCLRPEHVLAEGGTVSPHGRDVIVARESAGQSFTLLEGGSQE